MAIDCTSVPKWLKVMRAITGVTEVEQAKRIAEMWLEFQMNPLTQMVPGDPDCDACVLARQFIRATERLASMEHANGD